MSLSRRGARGGLDEGGSRGRASERPRLWCAGGRMSWAGSVQNEGIAGFGV